MAKNLDPNHHRIQQFITAYTVHIAATASASSNQKRKFNNNELDCTRMTYDKRSGRGISKRTTSSTTSVHHNPEAANYKAPPARSSSTAANTSCSQKKTTTARSSSPGDDFGYGKRSCPKCGQLIINLHHLAAAAC
ncbi:hypothetical protein BVC80_505g3 [Macleaya cordata]|uniref:Zinc finger protein n=1 Tax=Macleaya cordata TaxID=56857 RepID=A0A200PTE7_MACCD|nr:hypothetical protein BVC80_505g3 [Macleaya cordata]